MVDGLHHRVAPPLDAFAQVDQQDRIHLPDRFGGEVVAVHQFFRRQLVAAAAEFQLLCQHGLVIEHQTVLAAARQIVQAYTQIHQHAFVPCDQSGFGGGDDVLARQGFPVVTQVGRFRQPQHHLQITQTAGAFLDVGFKVKGDVVETSMTFALLVDLGVEVGLQFADVSQFRVHRRQQGVVAPDRARFEQAGIHGDVLRGFFQAFGGGAHRDTGLQPHVPKQADKAFHRAGRVHPRALR